AKSFLLPKFFPYVMTFLGFMPIETSVEELRSIYENTELIEQIMKNSNLEYQEVIKQIIDNLLVKDEKAIKLIEKIANNPEEDVVVKSYAREWLKRLQGDPSTESPPTFPTKEKPKETSMRTEKPFQKII
ncbi:hypothetical protein HY837_05885, partial [archaeon]|nr:hypothetical protein [archaeon]